MAIEEARKIRETVSGSDGVAAAGSAAAPAGTPQRDTIAEGGR